MAVKSERVIRETGTSRAIAAIKRRIVRGELLPGEQLRQERLATELGISRVPLREALLVLANQGLLDYRSQQGFIVAKRTHDELAQIHFLLDVLESELLRTLEWPDGKTLARLKKLNSQMADLVDVADWFEIVDLNHEFHSVLWQLSTRNLISEEVQRIWPLADAYIARGYRNSSDRKAAVEFHDRIIAAIETHNEAELLKASSDHRRATIEGAEPTFL
ncbi:GntR family transcriptional regulator [Nocardioides sp. 31GB23]|uniref:GntR family transcriptional regulator n=1 Tax=Nocardioides sp. 31GB23 TaxID=3156065 RepID=UPI0032AFBE09